ncbi:hypothetical protein ACFL4A_01400 [bacterium]
MKILLLSAHKYETKYFLKKFKSIPYKPHVLQIIFHNNLEIYYSSLGIGKKNISKRLDNLIDELHPDKVLLVGFAGSLRKNLNVGDVFVVNSVMFDKTMEKIESNVENGALFPQKCLITTDFLCDKLKKYALIEQFPDFSAVDMESFYTAMYCKQRELSIIIIKSISDDLNFQIPPIEYVKKAFSNNFSKDIFKLFPSNLRDIFNIMTLFQLRRNCKKAGKKLAKSIEKYLKFLQNC